MHDDDDDVDENLADCLVQVSSACPSIPSPKE
jgi:hypothetical protein